MDDLLGRARAAWANYAGIDGGFRPGLVNLGVNARSRICPPGWAGIVLLGNAAIVTAPAAGAERDLRRALSGVPMDQLTDRSAIESVMDVAEVLGPASLAFTDGASFRAVAQSGDAARFGVAGTARYGAAAAARAGGVARAGGAAGPDASSALAVGQLPATDDRLRALLASGPAGQAAETDLARIAAAVHVVLDGDRAVAAAGYLAWPCGVAHLSVLTDPAYRGRGLAKLAGSAAVRDALARGLLAQWRARVPASVRVAASLGFEPCGSQLSIRLAGPGARADPD